MKVWNVDMARPDSEAGAHYPDISGADAHGVEAYRPIDAAGYDMFRDVTAGLVRQVGQQLDTSFKPIAEEHSRHIHVLSTYSFGVGRELIPIKRGSTQELVANLGSDIPAEIARSTIVVYLAGLILQHKKSSLALSYAFGSQALARESFVAMQICDSALLTQPSITAGELHSPSKDVSPQQIENMVQAAFNENYVNLIDTSVDAGPLGIRPF